MPVLPLDRIYALGHLALRDLQVYRSPLARVASDHLPLVGNFVLNTTELAPGHQAGSPVQLKCVTPPHGAVPHRSSDRARLIAPAFAAGFASMRGGINHYLWRQNATPSG